MIDFASMILKGFSQIFFQDNIVAGVVIAVGVAIASPAALLLAIVGGAVSSFTNKLLGYDAVLYAAGTAAFNGIMIGCAMSFYFKSLPIAFVATIVGSCIGGLIFFLLTKHNIVPYAVPFVIVVFVTVTIAKFYN